MTTLAEAILGTARACGGTRDGVATGGSATTLLDSANSEPDDYFTGGTLWLLSGNNAGKSAPITTWDDTTHTFTIPTLTLLCAAGDRYAAVCGDYPRWLLVQGVNLALQEIGEIPTANTALLTVANQADYSLPAGVRRVCRLEIEEDGDYYINQHWVEHNGVVSFDVGYAPISTGETIRVWYNAAHADLVADADVVNAAVPLEQLRWVAAVHVLRHRMRHGIDNRDVAQAIADALEMAARNGKRFAGWAQPMIPDAHLGGW